MPRRGKYIIVCAVGNHPSC